jgi:hypothetical protein
MDQREYFFTTKISRKFLLVKFCTSYGLNRKCMSTVQKKQVPEVSLKMILGAPRKQHSEQMRSLNQHHQQ